MRIAHLIAQFYPFLGGAEICVHNVCRTLSESGHSATVITTTPDCGEKPDLPYDIIRLHPRSCGLLQRIPAIGKFYLHHALRRLQRKYKFDLWQVTMGYPLAVYAIDFFRKEGIPCVLRCCGEDIQRFPEIGYGYRLDPKINRLAHAAYPRFDGFVALTPSVLEEYRELGIPDEKVSVIPNGVNTAKFADIKAKLDRAGIRRKLGLRENAPLLLTVGRYHPKKGFDLIPEIAGKLRDSGLDFDWAVVGKQCHRLREKFPHAQELGVRTIEDFAASAGPSFDLPSSELIALYCAADYFVLPTLIETFGMVLVEAMAAGLPIVTTDAPGVRDVIRDGENGRQAKTGDTDSIAGIIREIMQDSGQRERLTANASREAIASYDWHTVTGKYLELYKTTVARKKSEKK